MSTTRPDPAPLARSENADLEASIASLRGPGSDSGAAPRSPIQRRARATSMSAIPPKTPLATLIRLVKPGAGSLSPVVGDSIWQLRTPAAIDLQMLFKRRITTVRFVKFFSRTFANKSYAAIYLHDFAQILRGAKLHSKLGFLPCVSTNLSLSLSSFGRGSGRYSKSMLFTLP